MMNVTSENTMIRATAIGDRVVMESSIIAKLAMIPVAMFTGLAPTVALWSINAFRANLYNVWLVSSVISYILLMLLIRRSIVILDDGGITKRRVSGSVSHFSDIDNNGMGGSGEEAYDGSSDEEPEPDDYSYDTFKFVDVEEVIWHFFYGFMFLRPGVESIIYRSVLTVNCSVTNQREAMAFAAKKLPARKFTPKAIAKLRSWGIETFADDDGLNIARDRAPAPRGKLSADAKWVIFTIVATGLGLWLMSSEEDGVKILKMNNTESREYYAKKRQQRRDADNPPPANTVTPDSLSKRGSGSFTDPRDNQTYRAVTIGNQTWMAENLNYLADGSWCYDNADSNCVKYGRLYNWDAAMTACPAGWRLPSDAEWDALMVAVGGVYVGQGDWGWWSGAGTKLKSTSGWYDGDSYYIPGTNEFGFSALPAGIRWSDASFYDVCRFGLWWSATEIDASSARRRRMNYNLDRVYSSWIGKTSAFSVRCLRD